MISAEVRGGMWLHLIGNSRISSNEVCWQNIGKSHAELIFNLFNKTAHPVMRGPLGLHQRAAFTLDTLTFRLSARF